MSQSVSLTGFTGLLLAFTLTVPGAGIDAAEPQSRVMLEEIVVTDRMSGT